MRRAINSAAKAAKNKVSEDPQLNTTISNLLRERKSTANAIYVGSKAAARRLITELKPRLNKSRPLLEINPGFGFLTREFLNLNIPKIKLYELSSEYTTYLKELKEKNPDRLDYKISDFFNMWKSTFLDRMDIGDRADKLFEGILHKSWESGLSMTVVGCMPSLNFLKHLNSSMVFQDSIIKVGRPEFYLIMLPKIYLSFGTDDQSKIFLSYKPIPVLFNMLFDHQIIAKLPRKDFLPIQNSKFDNIKGKTKTEILEKEADYSYLVHISGKEKMPVKKEYLPLLWYFCKHNLRNKENRIIPKLEEWIPGCGIWVITGQDPPGTNIELSPDDTDVPLPHITIFTQFYDLSPQQILTLFKKFISWPEFEQSPFKEALDNHMSKLISSYDSDVKIDIEQDYEPHEHE